MTRILPLIIICLVIVACAPTVPPIPLKEQLAGKSPEERQEILGLDCLNEGERMSSWYKPTCHTSSILDDEKVQRIRPLCLKMMMAYQSSDTKKRAELAQQCKEQILPALESDRASNVKHALNLRDVCEEITKQKINIPEQK